MIFDRDYMRTREERGPMGWLNPNGSMVKALILANVVVFLLDMLTNRHLADLLLLHPWYVRQFQFWRLITYQFAHGGFMHLLFKTSSAISLHDPASSSYTIVSDS